jgi:hypothetical protein
MGVKGFSPRHPTLVPFRNSFVMHALERVPELPKAKPELKKVV